MNLVKAGTLLRPNVCFICESFPPEGSVLVDTFRNYEQDTLRPLSGRKYVCESCVGELAGALGLSSGVGERVAKAENDAYRRAFETLRHRLRAQADELVALVTQPLSNLAPVEPVQTDEKPLKVPRKRAVEAVN